MRIYVIRNVLTGMVRHFPWHSPDEPVLKENEEIVSSSSNQKFESTTGLNPYGSPIPEHMERLHDDICEFMDSIQSLKKESKKKEFNSGIEETIYSASSYDERIFKSNIPPLYRYKQYLNDIKIEDCFPPTTKLEFEIDPEVEGEEEESDEA